MNSKGVVELGINAIIILILAMVFLAIAIIFVITIFSKAKVPDAPEFPFHATQDEPIVMSANQLDIKSGKEAALSVRVYNLEFPEDEKVRVVFSTCESDGEPEPGLTLSSAAQEIKAGQEATFKAVVKASDQVFPNTYSCIVVAGIDDGNAGIYEDNILSDQVYVIVSR